MAQRKVYGILAAAFVVLAGCNMFNASIDAFLDRDRPGDKRRSGPASIKDTFGITTTGTVGVTDTFNAVQAYLRNKTAAQLASEGIIQLGDYIDLPRITAGITVNDQAITPSPLPYTGYEGRLLRLIVVGINSFNPSGSYLGSGLMNTDNGAHLVFQFQNVAFTYNMNATPINTNGYQGSAVRTYLVGASGLGGANTFLTGLINAGVPDSVFWAPTRYVANKGQGADGTYPITDELWFPTEWEMFGSNTHSSTYETAENQARLAYYDSDAKRVKYYLPTPTPITPTPSPTTRYYWEASPYPSSLTQFAYVTEVGSAYYRSANGNGGCAPAFCVK